jgi:hypothetical protein
VRLEFKFREKVPPSQRREIVEKVAQIGASEVGPLFPGDNDPELASMYKAVGVPDDRPTTCSRSWEPTTRSSTPSGRRSAS